MAYCLKDAGLVWFWVRSMMKGWLAGELHRSECRGWWPRGLSRVGLHFAVPFPAQALESGSSTCSSMCEHFRVITLYHLSWGWCGRDVVVGGVGLGRGCVFGGLHARFGARFWVHFG